MNHQPRVARFSATDTKGDPAQFTVSNDIIDHMEAARTFGREDLADPSAHGRFQRRVIALPDRSSGLVKPMVLTIGNQNGLYLVRRNEKADGGWSSIDLGASLASAVGGPPQVRAVGAGWTEDDRITVAVAVDAGPGQPQSRVFAAYNLTSADSDWANVQWADCGTRAGVRVEGIRVLDEGDGTWTIALAGGSGPNEAVYLLRSDRNASFASALVFNPAVTLEDILDFEIGVHPTYGGGLHVLGLSGGGRVLAFRPFPEYDGAGRPTTIPPVAVLPCPDGANVLETGATAENGSNLYIAGQGIQLIPAEELDNAEDARVVQIADAASAASARDIAVGEAMDGSASVWALLQNGDLIVARKPAADAEWTPSLRLRTGVQEMAPVPGDGHAAASILAVYADSSAGHLWQDGRTGVWQEASLHVADPDGAMQVTCYGTSLRVLDENGAPKRGVKVSVTASLLTSVSLNGDAVLLGPEAPVEARTDLNGGIVVLSRVRSLTPAVYRFAVDGVAGSIDVNPASGMLERFKAMTGEELRGATVRTSSGDEPLLPDQFRTGKDRDQADAVAAALNKAAGIAFSSDGAVPDARVTAADAPFSSAIRAEALPDSFRWGIVADERGVRAAGDDILSKLVGAAQSAERFFVNLGHTIADFFEGIGERVKEGLTFVLHKAEGALRFVCAVGDKIKRFALSTLEEAGAFFKWLWAQVKTGLERVWDYVKFLFEWDDIILVRNAMAEATDEALSALKEKVDVLKLRTAEGFDHAIAQIAEWRGAGGTAPAKPRRPAPGSGVLDEMNRAAAPLRKLMDDVSGNSVVGWVTQKLGKLADEIVHVEGPNPLAEAADAAEQFVEGLLSDEMDDLMAAWDKVRTDLVRLFDGAMPKPGELDFGTIKDALASLGADVLEGVLTGLRDFVLRTLDLMRNLIGVARDALFARISFPFIEKLAKLVVPGSHLDTSFRMIDGAMLLCAIPATIAYKLMLGEAPFKKGDVIPFSFGNVTVQSGVDGLRRFSWAGGLAGSFMSMIISGYQAFVQGTVAAKGGKSEPAKAWQLWLGAGFGAIGVAAEMFGMHANKGDDVAALEWTMVAISGALSVKTVALLLAENKSGADPEKLRKASSGIDVIGSVVHFILRTAVFGKVIEADNKANTPAASDEKTTESLAWIQSLFDHAGSALASSADLDDDEETKAILLAFAGGGKGLAFVLDLIRVPITAQKQQLLTN